MLVPQSSHTNDGFVMAWRTISCKMHTSSGDIVVYQLEKKITSFFAGR